MKYPCTYSCANTVNCYAITAFHALFDYFFVNRTCLVLGIPKIHYCLAVICLQLLKDRLVVHQEDQMTVNKEIIRLEKT